MSKTFTAFAAIPVLLILTTVGADAAAPPEEPVAALAQAVASGDETLSFEERVAYQRRIEEVYWKHRIWPAENPGPKPALDAVLPDAVIRARVEDYLKKSNALDEVWGRPITAAQLQAEMNRMATQSRDPEILRELFAALSNDPYLIADTLARQTLADRLIRSWYSSDERFHGNARRQAEAVLQRVSNGAELSTLGAQYNELTYVLEGEDGVRKPKPHEILLDAREWRERVSELLDLLGSEPQLGGAAAVAAGGNERGLESVPLMMVSALQQSDTAFFATSVLAKAAESVTVATASWPKTSFDVWWTAQVAATGVELESPPGQFFLPEIAAEGTCVPDTWRSLPPGAPPAPDARDSHTAVWTGVEMIVWGGRKGTWQAESEVGTGGRYNPATDSWVATATSGAPLARSAHTVVWTGTEMVVWGGMGVSGHLLDSAGRYDPSTDSWVAMTTAGAPSARVFHTAVWTGSEMIAWGGVTNLGWTNTGGRYDPATDNWEMTSIANAPSGGELQTAVWTGEEMIVWGGHVYENGDHGLNTGGRYDPTRDRWEATGLAGAPSPRYRHTAVWTGSEMIIWGGTDGAAAVGTGARYDPRRDRWEEMTTVGAPAARNDHTVVWTGGEMIVWGGRSAAVVLDSGGRYNPSTDAWTGTSTGTGTPEGRSFHTAVWTGTEMIVWGGLSAPDGPRVRTGGRYDPSLDTWLATAVGSPVPSPREGYSVVWTGSEMIVWGGRAGVGAYTQWLSTGGRYNAATDSWLPTAPGLGGREMHAAVWTGSEMIISGGVALVGGGGPGTQWLTFSDGGRYDPTTDHWSFFNAVASSLSHTAVWTGSEMITWGGESWNSGADSPLNIGTRYNPSTNQSLLTTTVGAPTARSGHTAVWTGGEMVVWGGQDGWGTTGSGGRYDPATDSWSPTATVDAPAGRSGHSAVWTGSEMIIWGGGSSSGVLNTGSRYDPSTDSWLDTTTADAPAANNWHSAVWTGAEMIVWKGEATRGRYDPVANTWAAMATVGAPGAGRAVWTGSELIVWTAGGSGGRYCAPGGSTGAQITCNAPIVPADPQTCRADVSCTDIASCVDPDGGTVTISCAPGSPYGAGTTDVTVQCTDSNGTASAVCPVEVTVSDSTPPMISIDPIPNLLWPPNHHMVQVDAGVSASDNCGPPTIALLSVTSDEPDNGNGDGDTVDDIQAGIGASASTFRLRAERDGEGDGRVYTVTYAATDAAGNQATATATVAVPHDMGGLVDPVQLTVAETELGTYLSWSAVPDALYYNVVRTGVSALREDALSYDLGPAVCIEARSVSLDTYKYFDEEMPAPGDVFVYLVEYFDGLNRSTYGTASAAKPRVVASGDCE